MCYFFCLCGRWSIQSDGVSVEAALIEKLFNQATYICGFYWFEAKRTLCRIYTLDIFSLYRYFVLYFIVAVPDSIATNNNGSFARVAWTFRPVFNWELQWILAFPLVDNWNYNSIVLHINSKFTIKCPSEIRDPLK